MLLYQAGPEVIVNRNSFKVLKDTNKYFMKLHSSNDTVTRGIDFQQTTGNNHDEDCGYLEAKHRWVLYHTLCLTSQGSLFLHSWAQGKRYQQAIQIYLLASTCYARYMVRLSDTHPLWAIFHQSSRQTLPKLYHILLRIVHTSVDVGDTCLTQSAQAFSSWDHIPVCLLNVESDTMIQSVH